MKKPLSNKKIGIVVPARNEEKRIGSTIERYLKYFDMLECCKDIQNYSLLVALNDTQDNSLQIVKNYERNSHLKSLELLLPGKGRAIYMGFKYLIQENQDLIGFVDADCSTSPSEFYKLALSIENHDGVIASRYLKNSIVNPKQSLKRILASRIFNFYTRLLLNLPYKDTQCGAKIFKKQSLNEVIEKTSSNGWVFDIDLLYCMQKAGHKVIEVPTTWEDKPGSQFKTLSSGLDAAKEVLKLRFRTSL